MAVGIETLKIIKSGGFYQELERKREKLTSGLALAAKEAGVAVQQSAIGSMFGTFLNDNRVLDFESALTSDTEAFKVFFRALLREGVYIAPSQFETAFVSAAHSDEDIEATIEAASRAFAAVSEHRSREKQVS